MQSKVQPTANYWTDDVKMTSKVQPAADYWTADRENLGTRLCFIWRAKKQRAKWRNSLKNREIFWMNNKAIIEFGSRRIWRILQIPQGVIHFGLRPLWIQNSSYPTYPCMGVPPLPTVVIEGHFTPCYCLPLPSTTFLHTNLDFLHNNEVPR